MSNAFKYAESQYGPISTWPEVMYYDGRPQFDNDNDAKPFVDKYLAPSLGSYEYKYRKHIQFRPAGTRSGKRAWGDSSKWFYLKDGTCFKLSFGSANQHAYGILYDINGDAPPNSMGLDMFDFELGHISLYKFMFRSNIYYFNNPNPSGEEVKNFILKNYCTADLHANVNGYYNGQSCGWLIQYEEWKIPDYYPYKF